MIDEQKLRALVAECDIAATLYLPIDTDQRDARAPAARLRNLIGQVEERLRRRGVEDARADAILRALHDFADQTDFARHREPGYALFAAATGLQCYALPEKIPERVTVGRFFCIKPLLPLIARNRRFHILALATGRVRLLEATPFAWTELPLDDLLPLDAAAEADSRPAADAASGGKAPEELRTEILAENLNRVAAAVRARLGSDQAPLVLAAEPRVAGHFSKLAHLPQMLADTVDTNPFALSNEELHRRATQLIMPLIDAERNAVLESINARLGTAEPTVAIRLEEILIAARDGRVDSILVADDQTLWGTFDAESGTVTGRGTPGIADEDLLNLAAALTLRHGGRALAVPSAMLPRGAPAAALLRFPAYGK
ncbi:MAG TPA: hypothetical protein VJ779_22575 [Acetobacteraceae bacterium]|nr:hypothetical protein [Acetobacteraceae bacterium]